MRRLASALLAPLLAATALAAAPATELWNGRDLTGWTFVTNPAVDIATVCHATPEGALAAAGRPIGYLLASPETYRNFKLHVEWRWPGKPGNGGVLLHISSGPKDRQWPLCFQVQLKVHRAGDIFAMAGAACAEKSPATTLIEKFGVDSEKPPGAWNTCDITCRDGTIECSVNGVLENRVTQCTPASGQVGFQFEGTPFELRDLRLTPLP
jgi:3-keto-disaccharide hydrolase